MYQFTAIIPMKKKTITMRKCHFIFILSFLCLISSHLKGQSTCENPYIRRDSIIYRNLNSSLTIYSDSTFVLKREFEDMRPIYGIGDDTISYGKFKKYKNKALYLYTSPDITSSDLDIFAKEERQDKQQDSTITLILSSPYSVQKQKHFDLLKNAYFYLIDFEYADSLTQKSYSYSQIFLSDTIILRNYNGRPVKKIYITIYPYMNFGLLEPEKNYLSAIYTVQDIYANYFLLDIPKFTAAYMSYYCFYATEVELINRCSICIDKKTLMDRENCKCKKWAKKWNWIIHNIHHNPYEKKDDWYSEDIQYSNKELRQILLHNK